MLLCTPLPTACISPAQCCLTMCCLQHSSLQHIHCQPCSLPCGQHLPAPCPAYGSLWHCPACTILPAATASASRWALLAVPPLAVPPLQHPEPGPCSSTAGELRGCCGLQLGWQHHPAASQAPAGLNPARCSSMKRSAKCCQVSDQPKGSIRLLCPRALVLFQDQLPCYTLIPASCCFVSLKPNRHLECHNSGVTSSDLTPIFKSIEPKHALI